MRCEGLPCERHVGHVRVAVIDSGIDATALGRLPSQPVSRAVVAATRFAPAAGALAQGAASAKSAVLPESAAVAELPPVPDRLGHGTEVARLIVAAAPDVDLLSAQVFADGRPGSVEAVAAAIDWAVAQGAQVINLSLGLRDDRWALRHACACAHAAGVLLVASMPARGAPVYPAAYPEVIAVCGDARCRPSEWSQLAPRRFGACPAAWGAGDFAGAASPSPAAELSEVAEVSGAAIASSAGGHPLAPGAARGGASYAAARLSGLIARWLAAQDRASGSAPHTHLHDRLIDHLAAGAAYRGRERHVAEHAA